MDKNSSSGLIERLIKKYIDCENIAFVFPNDIAASMWKERALDFRPVLPDERFIAWDSFKRIEAERAAPGRAEATDSIRALYAENLAERNAEAAAKGKPLLSAVIPAPFAASSSVFSKWISRTLPHLAFLEEKREQAETEGGAAARGSAEARDFNFILSDYKAFLESHLLFESGWLRLFEGGKKKYIIIFHELIEDFSAFAAALAPAVLSGDEEELPSAESLSPYTAISAPPFREDEAFFSLHDDFRGEFKLAALKIEGLLMRGESTESIAVSLSNPEESAAYFLRELETRGIPLRLRFGHKMAESGAGRLFFLIEQCKMEDFSFDAVKKLLSLKSIPWLEPAMPAAIIRFGIENHCAVSWHENGRLRDAWEGAFRSSANAASPLRDWYTKLKRNILSLTSAKTFAAVRNAWFAFRGSLLDEAQMERKDEKGKKSEYSLEMGSCIKELQDLAAIEKDFPDLTPKNPFSFFVSRLSEKRYVPQGKSGGVSVFASKDAAAAPFKYHFVTGVTQEDATLLHQELDFLRGDAREALTAADKDASTFLFSSYICGLVDGGMAFFSASKRAVDSYKTVHGIFSGRESDNPDEPFATPCDPFELEERRERPPRIYPAQKEGIEFYSKQNWDKQMRFSFIREGFDGNISPQAADELDARISHVQKNDEGEVRVSATDLKTFVACPARWFMQKALGISVDGREFSPALELVDAKTRGSIFHKVFEELYKFILKEDKAFRAEKSELYLKKAEELIPAAIDECAKGFKGPLAEPVRPALEESLKDGAESLIGADCALLDGFIPEMTETKVAYSEGGIEFFGIIDRISKYKGEDGTSTVIIDYKTGGYSTSSSYEVTDGTMEDFQIPFYVFLSERALKKNVTQAWIFSTKDKKYVPILNTEDGVLPEKAFSANAKPFKSMEDFAPSINAMKEAAAHLSSAVKDKDFSAEGVYTDTCINCDHRSVCRRIYAVGQD